MFAHNLSITVTFETSTCQERAHHLACQLGLPVSAKPGIDPACLCTLYVTEHRLELVLIQGTILNRIFSEFVTGPLGYRRRHGGGKNQAIARAVGLRLYAQPITVLDVTAGLGKDGFILASLGCTVRLVERSPIMAALLQNGLQRAAGDQTLAPIIHSLHVIQADAIQILQGLSTNEFPDVIYVDPMFPVRTKSALPKIEMRIISALVGPDNDADTLLFLALQKAKKRVVVKRPIGAPSLSEHIPSFVVEGKSNRYDVYLTNQNSI